MTRRRRLFVSLGAALAGVIIVASLGSWFILRSNWFRDEVRRRVIAEVERATGGKVELKAFDYDWHTLTAEFHGLVVHGTEPPETAPLLRVETLRVTLRIISILERSVDLASLVVDRPQVNLLIGSSGQTNIPLPQLKRKSSDGPLDELLNLKLKHFEVNEGSIHANDRQVPIDIRGDGLALLVGYRGAPPGYDIQFTSRQIFLDPGLVPPGPVQLNAHARVERDSLRFQQLDIVGADSNLHAAGDIRRFANPTADFKVDADLSTEQAASFASLANFRGGRTALHGTSHYGEESGISFTGRVEIKRAGYLSRAFTIKNVDASSDVVASNAGARFRRLTGSANGTRFSGEGTLNPHFLLDLNGNLTSLSLREAAAFFTDKPLAWSATAGGRVRLTATLARNSEDLAVETQLHLNPAAPGIPLSGDVELHYRRRGNLIEFGNSHLNLPASQVSFSGALSGDSHIVLDSSNLADLKPLLNLVAPQNVENYLPVLASAGSAHFDGTIANLLGAPRVDGTLAISQFHLLGHAFDRLQSHFTAAANGINFASLDVRQGTSNVSAVGFLGLERWMPEKDSPISGAVRFSGLDIGKTVAQISNVQLPIIRGIAAGALQISGSMAQPQGSGHFISDSVDAYGETLNKVQFDASLKGENLLITGGKLSSGAALLQFSGGYLHNLGDWRVGQAQLKVDSNGFPLRSLSPVRKYEPGLDARAEIHFSASAGISPNGVVPISANGTFQFREITLNKVPYGNLSIDTKTQGRKLEASLTGELLSSQMRGHAQVELSTGNPVSGEVVFDRTDLAALYAVSGSRFTGPFDGFLQGRLSFSGPLQEPSRMKASLQADRLQLSSQLNPNTAAGAKSPQIVLHNAGPVILDAAGGLATVRSFRIEGNDTGLSVTGTVPLDSRKTLDLKVVGSVNLQILNLFDQNVESSGVSNVSASVTGTFRDPLVNGTLDIKNGSFFPESLSNGLSAVNGTVSFNRNRATLQKMTARSGGGELSLGGFVSFGGGGPLVYHLAGNAQNVRLRYAGALSVTVTSTLRLSGTSSSSILSGTLAVSRVVFNPNTDVGNLAASFGALSAGPSNDNPFLSGMHLDVGIESAPNLQLTTALSRDVEAEINLRLRGSPDHPILLGSLSANQGDIRVFGTRYSINRGEVNFVNSVKIEPVLDLDLETEARGITVDITIAGTFNKLNITYRSDPPLQPRDIVALLTVGRTPDAVASNSVSERTNEANASQPGGNSLLGAAVSSPASNRLSKLFGITNIKIDPYVQGLTNTPQARLSVEQQISRDITVTYVTNLSQTSEQIFRVEWAFSRQFSVVALRDDNGEFGIDFQYKKRFK